MTVAYSDPQSEAVVLGAALANGYRIPPDTMAHRLHREIAAALEVVDLSGSEWDRVQRVAEELQRSGRWDPGATGHVSWSTLSSCVLAYDSAGDDVLSLAVSNVQDLHRRRVVAWVGVELASSIDRGADVDEALSEAVGALGRLA